MSLESRLEKEMTAAHPGWSAARVVAAVAACTGYVFVADDGTLCAKAGAQGALRAEAPGLALNTVLTPGEVATLTALKGLVAKGVLQVPIHDTDTTIVQERTHQ